MDTTALFCLIFGVQKPLYNRNKLFCIFQLFRHFFFGNDTVSLDSNRNALPLYMAVKRDHIQITVKGFGVL